MKKSILNAVLRLAEIMVVAVIVFQLPFNGDLLMKAGTALAIIFALDYFIRRNI